MEPMLDQVVYGGYATLNTSFLSSNAEVNCQVSGAAGSCGGVSRRRDCHSAPPASPPPCSRRFNSDGEGMSAK